MRIIFDDRTIYVIPRRLLEGLEDAAADQLRRIEILADGPALAWPLLEVTHSVPQLLRGVYGSEKWMASVGLMPRAVRGQPLFGSKGKKAEGRKHFLDDSFVMSGAKHERGRQRSKLS